MSSFIPLHHIKNGIFGWKGHVCTFVQEISTVCNILPRKLDSVKIIKVIHHYQQEINRDMCKKAFKVRKIKVLNALKWLKEYHVGYNNITIEPANMSCIPEAQEEGDMESPEIHDELFNSIFFNIDEAPLSKIKDEEDNETETEQQVIKNNAKYNNLFNTIVKLWGNRSERLHQTLQ